MEENINELIYLCHQRDEEALKRLIRQFRPMVQYMYNRQPGFPDRDEYFMMADLLLLNCLQTYRQDLPQPFSAFFRACLKNRSIDEYSRKRKPEQYRMFSLDDLMPDEVHTVSETVPDLKSDTARQVRARMMLDTVQQISRDLGPEAGRILNLRARSYTLREIAEITGLPVWKVRYQLDRIKERAGKKLTVI